MADFNGKLNELNNTKDHTADYDENDINNNKVMGVLAYLGLLVLVPIFAAKNSKFARFHANQGLVLLIVEAIVLTVVGIVFGILGNIRFIGWIFRLINWLINCVVIVPNILGIVNAARGRAKELPIIGSFRILK